MVVVCENRFATILAHRWAAMRSPTREGGSLNRPHRDADGNSIDAGSLVPASQHDLRTGQHHRTHEEMFDLAYDVVHAAEQLPPQLRELCERLMYGSVSDVARETGVSRPEVYRRIGLIRRRFERAGLRDYL